MYTDLKSYQQALIIHDLTVEFIKRYIPANSRTRDQMEQAARSGKQNIVEASSNSRQKSKSELMLLAVASASLKELLEDYKDYLRQHGLSIWTKDDPRTLGVRDLAYTANREDGSYTSYKSYQTYLADQESACNAMICLINQTTYLVDQQIRAIEKQQKEAGVTFESRNQRAGRALAANRKREAELDEIIKREIEK